MKRIKEIFIVATCILMWAVLLGGWSYTLKTSTPAGTDDPREADDRIRELKAAFVERLDIDHYFAASATSTYDATDCGKHRYVTFVEPNDLTSMSADESALFSKDASSVTELHWIDESDNVLQITSSGELYVVTASIADANVTLAKMADDSIDSDQYVDGSVDWEHLSDGMVVQLVNTITGAANNGTTTVPYDDSIPQITEGDEYMTLAITPKATTNNLKIDVVFVGTNSAVTNISVALFQDSTANSLASVSHMEHQADGLVTIHLTHYMAAGTASETTFKVRAGGTSGTTYFNGDSNGRRHGGVHASSITIMEIKGS